MISSGASEELMVVSGTAHPALTEAIVEALGVKPGKVHIRRFPGGEIFCRYEENVRGRDLFIVQPTCSPPNENLMELLILADAARRASADRITAVIPYFGYARQDRKDQPRVPITAKLVANVLIAAGADRILCIDLHAQQIQGFFDIPVDHLYAAPEIVKYLRGLDLDPMTVVSPDPGGLKMAHAYSIALHAGLAIVGKRRIDDQDVEAMQLVGDVKGRNVVIVDDMTSTAGTLCSAASLVKRNGAKTVVAAVSHCMLTDLGIERLRSSAVDLLVTTDTTPVTVPEGLKMEVLTVSHLLAKAILRIHKAESVSSLFDIPPM
jgi:ribose-phosphate pyrophosphokinase